MQLIGVYACTIPTSSVAGASPVKPRFPPPACPALPRPLAQQVTFKVEFQAGASGRNFGWIKLDGESLAAAVAKAGWARVKDQGASSKSSELDELVNVFFFFYLVVCVSVTVGFRVHRDAGGCCCFAVSCCPARWWKGRTRQLGARSGGHGEAGHVCTGSSMPSCVEGGKNSHKEPCSRSSYVEFLYVVLATEGGRGWGRNALRGQRSRVHTR